VEGRKYFCIPWEKWLTYQPGVIKETQSIIPGDPDCKKVTQSFAEGSEIDEPVEMSDEKVSQSFSELVGESLRKSALDSDSDSNTDSDSDSDSNSELESCVAGDDAQKPGASAHKQTGRVGDCAQDEKKPRVSNHPQVTQAAPIPPPNDLMLSHPAIMAIKAVTGYMPPRGAWEMIMRVLGENPDLEKLKTIYARWVSRGYKKTNLEGMLEWYKRGVPEHGEKKSDENDHTRFTKDKYAEYIIH
jgi:hypothetical protein